MAFNRKQAAAFRLSAVIVLLLLGACNLATPGAPQPPTDTAAPNVAYTAAAETIIAQLTEIAGPETPAPSTTPQNGATGLPVDTVQPAMTAAVAGTAEISATMPVTLGETPSAAETEANTATPSLEPTITATSLPTATPVEGDPKLDLGSPSFQDTFQNADNWPLYDDEHVQMRIKDGMLQMNALNADKWDSWMLSWNVIQNYYLEMTATPSTCSGRDHYGTIFRAPTESEGYLFALSCDGQYSLRRWNGERYLYLVEWTPSEYILSGANQTNRLGVMADGNSLGLYANGHLLSEVTDSSFKKGGFGVFVGSYETTEFKVRVSEVSYWLLP